ncbi:MAG: beta-ketoacyl-[acyl-carrier-protein] synthase II [Chloroflexi bacterium RBG_16_48_8]|nr:MAG: beta-ketoacyl-[acyl-carrier-protein] synthase II [Chloroflexi bacterium RBG_16_48_8]
MTRRVVITGMGTVNPLGKTVSETWENILNGVSGVGPVTHCDTSDLLTQIACEVKDFQPTDYLDAKQARRVDRFQQFAIAACREAFHQSGLEVEKENPSRIAAIVSSAVGGLDAIQETVTTLIEDGPRRISPFMTPMFMANGAAGLIAIEKGIKGPCFSIASACASANDAIGQAALLIQFNRVDVAITGGSEATINRTGISVFDRLGALSRRNEDYHLTPSPFDRDRDGFVMAEGAAILILESLEHAKARDARIFAELIGYGSTVDAFHVTAPAEDGSGAGEAILLALEMAGLNPADVDYVNAHGTGTELNDISETRAIKLAFGDHAYRVPVSSTKSMTGHMIGATGALESIFCILAIQNSILPPTIHLQNPDPLCDLDYVPNEARQATVKTALNNAFGFGGQNAVLAFRAFSG